MRALAPISRQIATVTASLIDEYDHARAGAVSARTKALVGASSRNRDLAVLRAMLRLAKRWGYIADVPEIHLHKEPEDRVRRLEPDEEARLLAACRASKNASPTSSPSGWRAACGTARSWG